MGEFYTQKKICNHGSHFDPHASKKKKMKHAGQLCKKSVKKIMGNIWKMGIYSLIKSYQNRSVNMAPLFSENGLVVRVLSLEVQAAMQWPGDQKPKNFSQTRQRQSEYYYDFSISTCRLLLLYWLFSFAIMSPDNLMYLSS